MEFVKKCLLVLTALAFSASANAYLIGLEDGDEEERAALVGTLQSMGHTVTTTINGSLDLIISAPGNGTDDYPDIPYLQISDHGADHLANDWAPSFDPATEVIVTLTGDHPILAGLSPSWSTYGFWHYNNTGYIGWVTGVPGLADAEVNAVQYANVLAVDGADIYIGWNVYGPDATPNDLQLLSNAIEYLALGHESAPVPSLSTNAMILMTVLLALVAMAYHRRRRPV